jgi:CBS domain-containing protein
MKMNALYASNRRCDQEHAAIGWRVVGRRPFFRPTPPPDWLTSSTARDRNSRREALSMRVSDVLQSNRQTLQTCIPEESIASICTRLSTLNIGAFPVCDAHGALIGIISERDVVRAFAKDGARLADMHVRDLMTVEVKTCGLETPMVEAEKLMNKLRVRHLPVMDGGKLVGMLSIRDVMVWRQQEARDEVNVLRDAMIAVRNR